MSPTKSVADERREQAAAEEKDAVESERTAKYFRHFAQGNRHVAETMRIVKGRKQPE